MSELIFSCNICKFISKYQYSLSRHIKIKHRELNCLYYDATVGSNFDLNNHKIVVHKISICFETKTEELPNGQIRVTTLQTEEDEHDKFLFFSRSIIIKDMKIRHALQNHEEDKQHKCNQ